MTATRFTQYLPAREDVLDTLGLRPSRASGPFVGLALLGAGLVIGSAFALLLTPRSGAELRRELRDRFDDMRNRIQSRPDEEDREIRPDGKDRDSASA